MATRFQTQTQEEQQTYNGYGRNAVPAFTETSDEGQFGTYNPYKTTSYDTYGDQALGEQMFEVEKEYNNMGETTFDDETVSKNMFIHNLENKKKGQIVAQDSFIPRINARGKIMIAVYSVIVAILIAFTIYNAVLINKNGMTLAAQNAAVAVQDKETQKLREEYNELGTEESVLDQLDSTFVRPTEADIVLIEMGETYKRSKIIATSTNWFDKLCDFLSGLFD